MKHEVDIRSLRDLYYENEIAAAVDEKGSKSLIMRCGTDGTTVFKILKNGTLYDSAVTLPHAVLLYNRTEVGN